MIGAWFTCWDCGCCDAQRQKSQLPKRCPGHNKPMTVDNSGVAVEWIEREDGEPIPVGHECALVTKPCSAVTGHPAISSASAPSPPER